MSTTDMRGHIAAVYPNWKAVKTMPDDKVLAIYKSLQKRGKVK